MVCMGDGVGSVVVVRMGGGEGPALPLGGEAWCADDGADLGLHGTAGNAVVAYADQSGCRDVG